MPDFVPVTDGSNQGFPNKMFVLLEKY